MKFGQYEMMVTHPHIKNYENMIYQFSTDIHTFYFWRNFITDVSSNFCPFSFYVLGPLSDDSYKLGRANAISSFLRGTM